MTTVLGHEPNIPVAIAAIDEQIAYEDQCIHDAGAALHDAQVKLERLHSTREQLAALAELYTGEAPPPPVAPDVSDHPTTNGHKAAAKRPSAQRQAKLTDEQLVDAIRGQGGRATVVEVAGVIGKVPKYVRDRLNVLVEREVLNIEGGDATTSNRGRPGRVYVIPAPRTGSPDEEVFERTPTERLLNETIVTSSGEQRTPPDDDDDPHDATGSVRVMASDDAADGQSYDVVDAKNGRKDAPDPDAPDAPEPTPTAAIAPARRSPNLSRLPKREAAPPISAATRRAMKQPAKPPARMDSLDARLMVIFEAGANDARWKIGDMRANYGRRWPGPLPSNEEFGHALGLLMAKGELIRTGDWYTLS